MLRPRVGGGVSSEAAVVGEERRRRDLLFGRRNSVAATGNVDSERLEEANHEAVDTLYGQVTNMRDVSPRVCSPTKRGLAC